MHLEAGLRITENIELRFPIGEGGMGRVWAADHIALGRQVAVKFVSLALSDDAGTLQRFAHEAQMLARLKSQYSPQIFDFGTLADGTPFIVMELLGGVSLQTRLRNDGFLSLAETAQLVAQVCSVLSSAHALGIIHRDIKPENIILVPDEAGGLTVAGRSGRFFRCTSKSAHRRTRISACPQETNRSAKPASSERDRRVRRGSFGAGIVGAIWAARQVSH
jgi:serine/threonine protein kinase